MMPHAPHTSAPGVLAHYSGQGPRPQRKDITRWSSGSTRPAANSTTTSSNKLDDNTVILYLADNGWDAAGRDTGAETLALRTRHPHADVRPLAGQSDAHRDDETLASIIDFVPTILKLAGAKAPDGSARPGPLTTRGDGRAEIVFVEAYTHDIADLEPRKKASSRKWSSVAGRSC